MDNKKLVQSRVYVVRIVGHDVDEISEGDDEMKSRTMRHSADCFDILPSDSATSRAWAIKYATFMRALGINAVFAPQWLQ